MSGLDEQYRDVPICPICGKQPAYWLLTDNEFNYALWLYSQKYIEGELGKPYNEYKGEGFFKYLSVPNIRFRDATCCSSYDYNDAVEFIGGCGNVILNIDYPDIFEVFKMIFEKYFPANIYRK